jgi:sulfite reductase (NADPH) flavoprotein alpha-component
MPDTAIRLSSDTSDWGFALGFLAVWLALTVVLLARARQRPSGGAEALVVCASQTGHAGDLAQQAQLRIAAAGTPCALVEADHLTPALIAEARLLVFVASTTGEGEAPDNARHFAQGLLAASVDLSGKQVAVLALGDRRYTQFCAFGRCIAAWARQNGGEALFPPVEVDDLKPADLAVWDQRLSEAGYPDSAAPAARVETRWRVVSRDQVAGPSHDGAGELTGDGLYRIALRPAEGPLPTWEIGDLFELRTPDGHLRDYSIASLPGEDAVRLYVRRVIGKGVTGIGSGHLTDAEPGAASLLGRIRSHRSFRPPTGQGPLLAIGAGSGWAGLRPHLLHAISRGQPCRLVFGERASEAESPLLAEIAGWRGAGRLDRLDLALSRAGQSGPYVQHVLADAGGDIAEFLGTEGRIAICGRLAMGEQSLAELARLLGNDWLTRAREDGRLLRDLY